MTPLERTIPDNCLLHEESQSRVLLGSNTDVGLSSESLLCSLMIVVNIQYSIEVCQVTSYHDCERFMCRATTVRCSIPHKQYLPLLDAVA